MKKLTLSAVLLIFFVFALHTPSESKETNCFQRENIKIISQSSDSNKLICEAAKDALGILANLGILQVRDITIEIVEKSLFVHDSPVYGSYDGNDDRVRLMSYQAIQRYVKNPVIFGQSLDQIHYRGMVAHEVAHAAIYQQTMAYPVSASTQEYLAYTVQLAVLPRKKVNSILKKMVIQPWMPGDTISEEYMEFEPNLFAVKSYKHLSNLDHPAEFVQQLLQSKQLYVYVPELNEVY